MLAEVVLFFSWCIDQEEEISKASAVACRQYQQMGCLFFQSFFGASGEYKQQVVSILSCSVPGSYIQVPVSTLTGMQNQVPIWFYG